jgi:hypothetical protein
LKRHRYEAVASDDILGGSAEVLVLVPELEIERKTYHICRGDEAELVFYLKGGELASDWKDWKISFYNELNNETFTLEHVDAIPISSSTAKFIVKVSGSGIYRFSPFASSEGLQHCDVLKLSGSATVIVHDPPSLELIRYDCQAPVYVIFQGAPPFVAAYRTLEGHLEQFNSSKSSILFPFYANTSHFESVEDAYCGADGLEKTIPPHVESVVNVQQRNNTIEAFVEATGKGPVSLSYYKTNMTLHQKKIPDRTYDQTLEVAFSPAGVNAVRVKDTVLGATSLERFPGWLSPPEEVREEEVDEKVMAGFVPDHCRVGSWKRTYKSFVSFQLWCNGNTESVLQMYETCSKKWHKLQVVEDTRLAKTRPFSCFMSNSPGSAGALVEDSPDSEILGISSQIHRKVEMFMGKKLKIFGIISQSFCGVDCLILKCHLGDGEAILVRLFRSSMDCQFEILAVQLGVLVTDRLFMFDCSNAQFDTSYLRKSNTLVEDGSLKLGNALKLVKTCYRGKGPLPGLVGLYRVPEEADVTFAKFEQGVTFRLEGLTPVSYAVNSFGLFYFQHGDEACRAVDTAATVVVGSEKVPEISWRGQSAYDLNFMLLKHKAQIEAQTGDFYDCLIFQKHLGEKSAREMEIHSGSHAACEKQQVGFNVPTSVSELITLEIEEHKMATIEIEESICYSFGHVRDGEGCEGRCTSVEICSGVALETQADILPTIHISGGGLHLRPGAGAKIFFYLTGKNPFSFDLYLNGNFLKHYDEVYNHIDSYVETLDGHFTIRNFLDSEKRVGIISGSAEISHRIIPTASLVGLEKPCRLLDNGSEKLIDFEVELKSESSQVHKVRKKKRKRIFFFFFFLPFSFSPRWCGSLRLETRYLRNIQRRKSFIYRRLQAWSH